MAPRQDESDRIRWIEITADYRCNNRCLGCFAVSDDGPSMDTPEIAAALRLGRERGADNLWLGGGEPTMRRDLFSIVRRARKMGYTRVRVQTNGMLLSYPDFARRSAEAGVTEICFGIRGASPRTHDRIAATPGCHELMSRGMREAVAAGIEVEADLLIYRDNYLELPEMVRLHAPLGVSRFHIWLFSTTDDKRGVLAGQVPRISEIVPLVTRAMDLGISERPDFITSLHTPPCTVPKSHHDCLFFPAGLGLLVVNPGGHSFMLETSPIEGGHYLERCAGCAFRGRCGGTRSDYLRIHGDEEFVPL